MALPDMQVSLLFRHQLASAVQGMLPVVLQTQAEKRVCLRQDLSSSLQRKTSSIGSAFENKRS
jgi:hypothetical protein